MVAFRAQQVGVRYLTEGGQETELMYKHGHHLPEFALYALLDDPAAVRDLTAMYTAYLQVAADHGFVPLMGGLDYRASPDWASKLGYSQRDLVDLQLRSLGFLREVAAPFGFPEVLVSGLIGPRGDAYGQERDMSAEEAEDYHSVQISTLAEDGVDLAQAMTFNSVVEAVGVARAAHAAGLPLSVSFMVDSEGRLTTGPTLREAVEAVDAATGPAAPSFYGINCSHPLEFGPALEAGPWRDRLRMLRPNASSKEKVALCQIGHLEAGDPAQLGRQMAVLARDLPGVDAWGGCCGTWDDHLRAVAGALTG